MGNITNKAQKYLLNNKCADLLLNDNRTTRIEDRIYVSDIMMMFLRSEREQKESEQQSNCNLPHVSVSLLSGLPENMPLYKDSGLWQLRTDDMDEVILQQSSDESDDMFIAKCRNIQRKKESKDSVCAYCSGSGKAMNVKYDLPCQVCKGTGIAN